MKIKLIDDSEQYPEDITRIVDALQNKGFEATRDQAEKMWKEYSDSMAAGWLLLPETDDEIFMCIGGYFEAAEDGRDPACVDKWPECYNGGTDPKCCRFPKSCSC